MQAEEIDQVKSRLKKLEDLSFEEFLTLVEIMSNATFFGDIKRTSCEHAKEGQCGLFFLGKEQKQKIPIVTDCRIQGCDASKPHSHIELSNVTCTLCPQWKNNQ